MPAKWSRPVFSFGFYEGKISQLLGDEVLAFERLPSRARRAIGDTRALHQVIDARAFDSAQVSAALPASMAAGAAGFLHFTQLWERPEA